MKIGKFKKLVIIGGDSNSLEIIDVLNENKIDFFFITSKRNIESYNLLKNTSFKKKHKITKSIKDLKLLKKYDSIETLFLLMTSPWIISSNTLKSLKGIMMNTHAVRLPQNRGGASLSWQILNRHRFGFTNLHLVNEKIDAGDLVFFKEFIYPLGLRTPKDFMNYFRKIHVSFLKEKLIMLFKNILTINPMKQNDYLSTYWPRLNSKINSWIDWSTCFEDLSVFISAFDDPYDGAQTFLNNKRVFLKKSLSNYEDQRFHPYQAGLIYRVGPDWACVAANKGSIIIEEVWNESNNNIVRKLKVGDRFYTPVKNLSNTSKRIFYNSIGIKKNKR